MEQFIVFSDLHLNAWTYGASYDSFGRNSRLENQISALEKMALYAHERDIKYLLFCGDFFHTHGMVKTEVLQGAHIVLEKIKRVWGIEIVWIVGNHDQADKYGYIHSLDILNHYGYYADIDYLELPGLPLIHGLSYTEDETDLKTFLEHLKPDSIVLMHQGVSGVEIGSKGFTLNEMLTPDMIPDHILHAFVGHYHDHRMINDKLTIPGAMMQHTWSDAGEERGFLVVTIEGKKIHIEHIDSGDNKFVKLTYKEAMKRSKYNRPVVPLQGFYKITGVSNKEHADLIRNTLFNNGALAVEIEMEVGEKEEVENESFDNFNDLFLEYIAKNNIEGRQLQIGREIKDGNYETPLFNSE